MVRGSRTPHNTQPMMEARVDGKGRMWGQQERLHGTHSFPFPLELVFWIWDLGSGSRNLGGTAAHR